MRYKGILNCLNFIYFKFNMNIHKKDQNDIFDVDEIINKLLQARK